MAKRRTDAPCIDPRWEAEDALRTLNRADEIRKNAKLMGQVRKVAQEQIKALEPHVKGATRRAK